MNDSTFEERRRTILRLAAEQALKRPLLPSGLWFHADVRDNLYLALHLHQAASEGLAPVEAAQALAEQVIGKVLSLQIRRTDSEHYGHWPLQLGDRPEEAPANPLTVEFIGSLLAYAYAQSKERMSPPLQAELLMALTHLYDSGLYRREPDRANHHNAKYAALQLMLGWMFDDDGLLAAGKRYARFLLEELRQFGMREYSALPWFWHWTQAFAFVRETVREAETQQLADELLEWLWAYRARYYLRGAWIGPHMRVLPCDLPLDDNTLSDYLQFGDIPAPARLHRLEAAALLSYRVPGRIRDMALERGEPTLLEEEIPRFSASAPKLHSYVYRTPAYAVGGVYEYVEEFLNEQHRWDISLPLPQPGINTAYFFHPCKNYRDGDERHPGAGGEMLFHRRTVLAGYIIPSGERPGLIGVLPLGEWTARGGHLVGRIGDVYIRAALLQPFELTEADDRLKVAAAGPVHAVAMECLAREEAAALGIADTEALLARLEAMPDAAAYEQRQEGDGFVLAQRYTTLDGDRLELILRRDAAAGTTRVERSVNGRPVILN